MTQQRQGGEMQNRGPGSQKVEIEKRLDANRELSERAAGMNARPAKPRPAASPTRDRQQARERDEALDEAIDESFPASDPPAHSSPIRIGSKH